MGAPVTKGQEKGVQDLVTLLSHPLRCRCQTYLCERTGSPNEMALAFRRPLGDVAYHVRKLEEAGCIELVDTAQRRGATEHYYRAVQPTELTARQYTRLSDAERADFTGATLRLAVSDALTSLADGTLVKRDDHQMARVLGTVDEEGWGAIGEIFETAIEQARTEIQAAASRIADDDDRQTFPVRVFGMVIEMPEAV